MFVGEILSEAPITYRPLLPYYILLFVVVMSWAASGTYLAGYIIVLIPSGYILWVLFTGGMLGTLIIPTAIVARKMKRSLKIGEIRWTFKTQEISFYEFKEMMNDYRRGYRYLIQVTNYPLIVLGLSVTALTVFLPYLIGSISITWLLYLPDIYGGLTLLLGMIIAVLSYQKTESLAGHEFPIYSPQLFIETINQLNRISGVSWAGIELRIGEAQGYYTLRNPTVVARVEGIESAALIVVKTDERGVAWSATSDIQFEDSDQERKLEVDFNQVGGVELGLQLLVRWTLEAYVSEMGSNEILDEILEEVPSIDTTALHHQKSDDLMTPEDTEELTGEESEST